MARSHPKRGEVWIVDLGYLGKRRPCVILSVDLVDEDRSHVTCVPRTTKARQTRFEVEVEATYFDEPGVFDAQGIIGAPLVKCERRIGSLTAEQLTNVENSVKRWLGLNS